GPTTDVRSVTVNKGTDYGSIVDVLLSNFTVEDSTGDVAGFLTITNGTVKFSGTTTLSNRLFAVAAWTIPASGGLWLDDPNLNVVAQAGSATMNGLLRLSQGTLNVGTGSGNSVGAGSGAWFDILGGALVVSGRIASANAIEW